VRFDPRRRIFHARGVPVAMLRREVFGENIKPLPGTCICVFKKSGRPRVVLVADADLRHGVHLVERNQGFFLQNLRGRLVN
jgi:hypothetical protein